MVGADGAVYAYGDVPFLGNAQQYVPRGQRAVGMVGLGTTGYAITSSDGAVYAFGTQPYLGGANTLKLAKPIVGIFQGGYL
jgi:hypothetical protein